MNVTGGGSLFGTPTAADSGTDSFIVRASDSKGMYADLTLFIPVTLPTVTGTFTSVAADDGWLLESTGSSGIGGFLSGTAATANGLIVGDQSTTRQYKSLVSFDTSTLPADAVIVSATISLKRGTMLGDTSSFGALNVDIAGPTGFNSSDTLEIQDFQAAPVGAQVATLSYPASNGAWASGTLNPAGLACINYTGKTQFRVSFTLPDNGDSTTDYLGFYPGDNPTPANRPTLQISYYEP